MGSSAVGRPLGSFSSASSAAALDATETTLSIPGLDQPALNFPLVGSSIGTSATQPQMRSKSQKVSIEDINWSCTCTVRLTFRKNNLQNCKYHTWQRCAATRDWYPVWKTAGWKTAGQYRWLHYLQHQRRRKSCLSLNFILHIGSIWQAFYCLSAIFLHPYMYLWQKYIQKTGPSRAECTAQGRWPPSCCWRYQHHPSDRLNYTHRGTHVHTFTFATEFTLTNASCDGGIRVMEAYS